MQVYRQAAFLHYDVAEAFHFRGSTLMQPPSDTAIKILFVDDEPVILQSLARLISNERFIPLFATSGEEGIEIVRNTDGIGVIVADHIMPKMSGTEFLQRVWVIAPDTIRILLTGHNSPQVQNEALYKAGVFRFIAKPFENEQFIKTLRDATEIFSIIKETRQYTGLMNGTSSDYTESFRENTSSATV